MQFSYVSNKHSFEELAKDNEFSFAKFVEKKVSEVIALESGKKRIEVGIGEEKDLKKFDTEKFIYKIREIVVLAKKHKIKKIALDMYNLLKYTRLSQENRIELVATNLLLAGYEFRECKSEPPKDGWVDIEEVLVLQTNMALNTFVESFERGTLIARKKNEARTLIHRPGNDLTPENFWKDVEYRFRLEPKNKIRMTHWDDKELKRAGFNGIRFVGGGSENEPHFVSIEYQGAHMDKQPTVIIGKGVTMDTGGLSVKADPKGMHMDMAGGAVAYKTLELAYELGLKQNVIALIPLVENNIGRGCSKVEDVVKMYGGKTMENKNCDAEGRIILFDAIAYAVKHLKPKRIITVATLTGAACVGLGEIYSGVFSRDKALANLLIDLGEKSGESIWQLPMNDKFKEMMKGDFADIKNLADTRMGGACTATAFLEYAVGDVPFAHFDIAPRMITQEGENLAKKSTLAEPTQTIVSLLEHDDELDEKEAEFVKKETKRGGGATIT